MNKKLGCLLCCCTVSVGVAFTQTNLSQISLDQWNVNQSAIVQSEIANDTGRISPDTDVRVAMATPLYPVTPGDVYTLSFAIGTEPIVFSIPVDSTYRLRIANLAVIDGAGKTFVELKKQVENVVIKNYPMSGVQFSLTQPAVFTVTVVGEVQQTTEPRVWALSRLSEVVAASKTDYSSLREVVVSYANGRKRTYDLFKAERDGDMSQDPYLTPGAVITLKRAERIVTLKGSIERPGIYQPIAGENLRTLLYYYGGRPTERADLRSIDLVRFVGADSGLGTRQVVSMDSADEILRDRDTITVPSMEERNPVFFIEGAIDPLEDGADGSTLDARTGVEGTNRVKYVFLPGETLVHAIQQYRNYFTQVADLEAGYLIRQGTKYPVNLSHILYSKDYSDDRLLEPNDVLIVPFRQLFVTVAGAVENPGRYPYVPDRNWHYYVGLAGGIDEDRNTKQVVKVSDMNDKKLPSSASIPPEAIIVVKSNSFLYHFNRVAPIITTILSGIYTFTYILVLSGIF